MVPSRKPEKIAPLLNAGDFVPGASVDFFQVRVDDADAGQLPAHLRRRQKRLRIEKDIVSRYLNPRHVLRMEQVRYVNMQPAEQALERNLQNVQFGDV